MSLIMCICSWTYVYITAHVNMHSVVAAFFIHGLFNSMYLYVIAINRLTTCHCIPFFVVVIFLLSFLWPYLVCIIVIAVLICYTLTIITLKVNILFRLKVHACLLASQSCTFLPSREPRWSSGYTSHLSSGRPGFDSRSWLPHIIHLFIVYIYRIHHRQSDGDVHW